MKQYDPDKGLIFIHIAKCAGTSVVLVLRKWFGENYYRKSFKKKQISPPLKPGVCISGHFNRQAGKGISLHYPEAEQFITFLRNPFETAASQYFFWKNKRRKIRIKEGTLKPGSELDYKSIDDFFKKRGRSRLLDFMPQKITLDNYKEVIERNFVYIGIAEDLQTSLDILAKKLGFPAEKVGHLNRSERSEEIPAEVKKEFERNNPLEYRVYNYILSIYQS